MAGRDIGAFQRQLSIGAEQAAISTGGTSVTQTEAVTATATATSAFVTTAVVIAAVTATATAASTAVTAAVATEAVTATATADSTAVTTAVGVVTEAVNATATADSIVITTAVVTDAVNATATADSAVLTGVVATGAVSATASAEDGYHLSYIISLATQTATATATATTDPSAVPEEAPPPEEDQTSQGVRHVTIRNVRIWDTACEGRPITLGNLRYPFGGSANVGNQRDQHGNTGFFVFENIWIEGSPTNKSGLYDHDENNTANNITIRNMMVGGVRVTSANKDTFWDVESNVYNVTFDTPRVTDPFAGGQ